MPRKPRAAAAAAGSGDMQPPTEGTTGEQPQQGAAVRGRGELTPHPTVWAQMKEQAATILASGFYPPKFDTEPKMLAIFLKAWELGIPLLTGLKEIFVSGDGQFGLGAGVQRGLIERAELGHIDPIELSPTVCRVKAVRYGIRGEPNREAEFSYTLAEATAGGSMGVSKYPQDTLFARATTRAMRALFSDVVAGVGYDPDELSGAPTPPSTPVVTRPPATSPAAAVPPTPEAPATPTPPAEPTTPAGKTLKELLDAQRQAQESVPAATPPAQAPAPPAPIPPAVAAPPEFETVLVGPGRDVARVLNNPVSVPTKDGPAKVLFTGGIALDTLRAIGGKTAEAGKDPDWKERQALARDWLSARGFTASVHLTEEEGQELLAVASQPIRREPVAPAGAVAGALDHSKAFKYLEEVLTQLDLMKERVAFETMIAEACDVQLIGQADPQKIVNITTELRDMAVRDPQTFMLAFARYQGSAAQGTGMNEGPAPKAV